MLPWPHLRFVLTTVMLEGEVTLGGLAVEGTNQVRPSALGPS